MNIAILIPTLTTGGAERAASTIGKHYSNQGHSVYYFVFSNSGRNFFDTKGEIVKTHIIYPFDQQSKADNIRELVFSARSLKKLKKKYQIDVSISFMEAWNILNICSRTRRELAIISVRTVLSERKEFKGFIYNKKVLSLLYNHADKIVAVSEYVKKDLVDFYGIQDKRIICIPNISERKDNDSEEDTEWPYGEKAVVCVGRFEPVKQFDSVVKAFSVTYEKDKNARLIIVGDGRQRNKIKKIIDLYRLNKAVILTGLQKNIGFYLKNARCFVMTSRVEGFPNAMVEAMAYGVPIISTDSPGGCGEILGKNTKIENLTYCRYGVMVPYIVRENDNDVSEAERVLGNAIYEMLSNQELYQKYTKQSLIRSEDYSKEKIMGMWNQIISG